MLNLLSKLYLIWDRVNAVLPSCFWIRYSEKSCAARTERRLWGVPLWYLEVFWSANQEANGSGENYKWKSSGRRNKGKSR
jgi:hypothetical protein